MSLGSYISGRDGQSNCYAKVYRTDRQMDGQNQIHCVKSYYCQRSKNSVDAHFKTFGRRVQWSVACQHLVAPEYCLSYDLSFAKQRWYCHLCFEDDHLWTTLIYHRWTEIYYRKSTFTRISQVYVYYVCVSAYKVHVNTYHTTYRDTHVMSLVDVNRHVRERNDIHM